MLFITFIDIRFESTQNLYIHTFFLTWTNFICVTDQLRSQDIVAGNRKQFYQFETENNLSEDNDG